MISGKNQIVRQKNVIDNNHKPERLTLSISNDCNQKDTNELNADVTDELEYINQSLAKLTYKLNTEEDEFDRFTFNTSTINTFDLTPSSSSSSSSPSNLLNTSNNDKSSKTHSQTSPSNKNLLTSNLREKFTKSKTNPNKQLISTNSVPAVTQPKQRRFANLMKLSQAGSFFSRSCPGDEITQNEIEDTHPPTTSASKSENSAHKAIGRAFMIFTTKNKFKKSSNEINSSSSPLTSSNTSVNSDILCRSSSPHGLRTNSNSSSTYATIGSYQVDLEKLARELILPSMDAPLTSFNNNSPPATRKPPLQSSKTIDQSDKPVNSSRKNLIRSLTQNK